MQNRPTVSQKAAGEVLTAKQAPHRPGTAPALGLRAGKVADAIIEQTTFKKEIPMWSRSILDSVKACASRAPRRRTLPRPKACRPQLEVLEDRWLPSFLPPVSYAAGATPQAVVTADFNGDGKLDLATTGYTSESVSILLGNGAGTFQPAQSYGVGDSATSLAVGDFDGRHYPNGQPIVDIAVRLYSGPVAVLLNKGDGTFGPATDYWANDFPEYGYQSLAVGDFNKDGKLDIVATSGYFMLELLGNGDGTFAPAQTIATSASPLAAVAVGDFNGDGTLDLAVTSPSFSYNYYGTYTNRPAEVDVLIGHGDGTFGSGPTYQFNAGATP